MQHFAGNDKRVAMKYLRPQQPRSRHMVTFLVGAYIQIQISSIYINHPYTMEKFNLLTLCFLLICFMFSGLFTGTFVSLFIIYAILAHVSHIFASAGNTPYMEVVYHVFR